MFVQIHRLKSYTNAVLPNRGQDGLAKRLPVGGDVRQRISSQCSKAALRNDDLPVYIDGPDGVADDRLRDVSDRLGIGMSVRSRWIFPDLVLPKLTEAFGNEELAKQYAKEFAGIFGSEEKAKKEPKSATEDKPYDRGYVDQPQVIGEVEVAAITNAIRIFKDKGIAPDGMREVFEKFGKSSFRKTLAVEVVNAVENITAMKAHCGIDGALFGRMITGSVLSRVDSCLHVSHSLTVHEIQTTNDYFSVQDKLRAAQGEAGASHTNSTELTSGLFYEYAMLQLRQMAINFASLDARQAQGLIAWVVRALYRLEAAAKLGPTAPYGNVPYFMVEVGPRCPHTLMDAFELALPVKDRSASLSQRAIARLKAYKAEMELIEGANQTSSLENEAIREEARATNRPAYEVLADKVAEAATPYFKAVFGVEKAVA